jgi:hypothetical protein
MLTVVENGVRSWRLAGIVYEGPNVSTNAGEALPGFEVIRARRSDFIGEDGYLLPRGYF